MMDTITGILLSTSVSSNGNGNAATIMTYIIGVAILAGAGYFIYIKLKKDKEGEAALKEFLNNLQDIFKNRITEAIDKFDFNNVSTTDLGEVESEFFEGLYNDLWNLCIKELDSIEKSDDVLYTILKKAITQDKLKQYVETIYSSKDIKDKFESLYHIALQSKLNESAANDAKLVQEQEAIENEDINNESSTVADLDPKKLPGVEETINPPVEEESDTVKADDPTVEILEEVKSELKAKRPRKKKQPTTTSSES